MTKLIATLALVMSAIITPAVAAPSTQHSANAVNLSGQAASEGSAALATGTAVIASVPIMTVGSILEISGAGLQAVGEGTVLLGDELRATGAGHHPTKGHVAPNGPPTLD